MRKTLTSNELETMISKCVGQVLAESRQKQTPRNTQKRVLTESQLQSYIQNVINEEMEKEGAGQNLFGKVKGFVDGVMASAKAKKEQEKYNEELKDYKENGGKKTAKTYSK